MLNWLRIISLFLLITITEASAYYVDTITVTGVRRISPETVKAYLTFEEKEEIDEEDINNSMKELYNTGFFTNISISPREGNIVVNLTENPFVRNIIIKGNKKVDDADIKAVLIHRKRSIFSDTKLQAEIEAIKELYNRKGLVHVEITPHIDENDNVIDIAYNITEGEVRYIKKITFEGNNAFSSRSLRSVISSKAKVLWRLFSSVDKYDPDRVEFDSLLLEQYYKNRGYYDFIIRDINITQDEGGNYIIKFHLEEGIQYRIKEFVINPYNNIDFTQIRKKMPIKDGMVFSEEKVMSASLMLSDYLNDIGYAFIDIETLLHKNTEENAINLVFDIKESPKVYINKFNIKNNTRTLDKVIRREIKLAEGDPYSASKLKRSIQKIKNLGFFNNVHHKNKRTQYFDRVDIDIEVEEMSTGEMNIGAGYSTGQEQGITGMVSLKERNFLGKGIETFLNLEKAERRTHVAFGVTDPYFLDKKLHTGFTIFTDSIDRTEQSAYTYNNYGISLSASYNLTEYLEHSLRYNLKREKVEDVPSTASIFVREQEGCRYHSSIGHTLFYNKLDDDYAPSSGYAAMLSQDYAGVGGDIYFIKHGIYAVLYTPVYKDKVILKVSGQANHIHGLHGHDVRINDRFFLGQEEIRGFDIAGIGPRDKDTGEALGGYRYAINKVELSFPLGLSKELGLEGYIFHDIGIMKGLSKSIIRSDVFYKGTLRASYGYGVKMNTPIGPLVMDLGFPYKKESFDKERMFRLSYRTPF